MLAYACSHLVRWSYTGLASSISDDLHLDKAALGLLGAAFFYPYALAQVPWGRLADRYGGRFVVGGGTIAVAACLALFSTSRSLIGAMGWRVLLGLLAACSFVPIAALLARWFGPRERGLANGVYHGLGGGLGEAMAFLLLPLLSLWFVSSSGRNVPDWRRAMLIVAVIVALVGVLSLALLRPAPGEARAWAGPDREGRSRAPGLPVAREPILWMLGVYFAAGIMALRLIPGWLTIYATDLYHLRWGMEQQEAMVAAGMVGVAYAVGHVLGSPLAGVLSDRLLARGIGRVTVAASGMSLSAVAVGALLLPIPSSVLLGVLAFLLGLSLQSFPIVNAVAAERWGIARAGESLGWINMIGQFAGALSLSVSGYLGMAVAAGSGGAVSEYAGIWWFGIACCTIGALAAWLAAGRIDAKPSPAA